jgi:hypothetical protein
MSASNNFEDHESVSGNIEQLEVDGHAFEIREVTTERGDGIEIRLNLLSALKDVVKN